MATLVLSTVGTMLGGPVGGAIGSLLGQSIDQQLLGPGARRGPRLGDLSVQTSTYGSAIPQLFGRMRVAGTIVWATDLKEQSQTQSAKGQPDSITYSYSVSLAVALSSRPVGAIGRIWADGKLIRTSDGLFSLRTDFRLCDGSEEQPVDPLISSIEGIGSTPAYRGLALAVFENLELADFGNRIPFLTFEVIADPADVGVGSVLAQVSDGAIASDDATVITGYAAHGTTISDAIGPLVAIFATPLFDDGATLSSPAEEPVVLDESQAGCDGGGSQRPLIERARDSAASLPTAVSLSYYDPERDYQEGLARASIDARTSSAEAIELPAVISADCAKALAQAALARRWAERDRLTLRLPPDQMGLRPGTLVQPNRDQSIWRIEQVGLDSLATVIQLRPAWATEVGALAADSGRANASAAVIPKPTSVGLVELPDSGSGATDSPVLVVSCAGRSPWRAIALRVETGALAFTISSAREAGVLGSALGPLPDGQSALFDLRARVDVQLQDESAWLESRDDDSLAAGANLAMLGSELVQFGNADALGGGVFRLSRLLRGRRGTEWAMATHSAGESFVLIDPSALVALPVTREQVGARIAVTPEGLADGGAEPVEATITGEAMRPPSPAHLQAAWDSGGNLNCSWVRRSHLGWEWIDSVDAPLGCAAERYAVTLEGSGPALTIETSGPEATFSASQVASAGDGELQLSVAQVGDYGASRPAALSVNSR